MVSTDNIHMALNKKIFTKIIYDHKKYFLNKKCGISRTGPTKK